MTDCAKNETHYVADSFKPASANVQTASQLARNTACEYTIINKQNKKKAIKRAEEPTLKLTLLLKKRAKQSLSNIIASVGSLFNYKGHLSIINRLNLPF